MMDTDEIQKAVASMIKAIGEDPEREGLAGTPERVARMYAEIFMGLEMDPKSVLSVEFEEGHREMVILKDIPFYYVRASSTPIFRHGSYRLYTQRERQSGWSGENSPRG